MTPPTPPTPPDAGAVRRRKLMACLLMAVEKERDDRPLRWRYVILKACQYAAFMDAKPSEFNQLLDLTVRELLGGKEEKDGNGVPQRGASGGVAAEEHEVPGR